MVLFTEPVPTGNPPAPPAGTESSVISPPVISPPVIEDSERVWTRPELAREAARLAHLLYSHFCDASGASNAPVPRLEGERIALLLPPGGRFAAALEAVWSVGAIAVPLGLDHPPAEWRYLLEDSGAVGVLVPPFSLGFSAFQDFQDFTEKVVSRLAEALPPGCRALPFAKSTSETESSTEALEAPQHLRHPTRQAPRAPALLLYTSGTTGKPKGVLLTRSQLEAQADTLVSAWGWKASDRILHVLPLHHTHGLVTALIAPLRGGACIVFEPRFEARSVWDAFSNRQITAFTAVPTVYSKLLRAWQEADLATRERWSAGAARLRLMVSGSAALSPPLFEAWYTITGHRLLERYGMTEIGMALSNPLTGERRPGTVGFPLPGVRVCRVDEQGREVLEPSVPGELWIAGDSVFLEYWRKPDATRAALSSAPLAPPPSAPPPSVTGQETLKEIMKNPALEKKNAPKQIADVEKSKPAPLKWFRTGDLAVVEEGFFRLLGRMSVDILKTGGYKVSAIEIEEAIRRIEGVEDCAVVGVADPEWGQKVACALVLSRPEEPALALERVRAEASRSLAPYKVPRLWRLVRELPRNAMGKVQKPGLAELFREASGPLGAVSGAWLAAVLSGLALSLARPALATVDEGTVPKSAEERALELEALFWDPVGEQPLFFGAPESNAPALPAAEAFRRSRAILNYYSAAEEPDPSGALAPLSGLQTEAGIRRLIGFLDFRAPQWNRFFSLGPTEWLSFQDRDAKGVADHAVRLAPPRGQSLPLDRWSGNGSEDDSFEDSRLLRAAQAGSPDRPLAGIRIAIDPGHMGGEPWDERTGKFVRDAKTGRRLSEGILNLQTALLLEARLQALGAQVFLTRRTLIPVTSLDYESFALGEFARKELRQSSLQDWFQRTLAVAPPGERLRRAFDAHPEVRKLFSEFSRSKYFISRADLEARADAIDAFDPDIALFIHYDTTSPSNDPTGTSPRNHNDTKAYVPGAFDPTEFASREDRAYFARHALQGSYWWQSVRLSEKIVRSLSSGLGIPLARFGGEIVKPVVPGVFSRNLALTRRVPGRVSSFLECMFYNTQEFPKLYAARHPLLIDGRNYPYSDRLLEVVQGIQTGVVDYVRSLAAPPSRRQ